MVYRNSAFTSKSLWIVLIFMLFGSFTFAQHSSEKPNWRELHYLSEAEMFQKDWRNPDFTETDPPVGPVRMVGEFEQMQAVLIRYPFGIPYTVISEMASDLQVITIVSSNSQANQVLALYQQNNVNTDNCSFLIASTDSYWTRDYGPWFVFDGNNQPGVCDFPYDRPRPNDDDIPVKVAQSLGIPVYGMDLTHTGGNMMADGLGTAASTDLVIEENTSMTEQQIRDKMQSYLGINQYDITLDPLGDYIKHIDCWGKYLAPDKVLVGRVPLTDERYADYEAAADYFENTISPYGYPYKVYRVFSPGTAPNTPYTNSIILNNKVLVPTTGSQFDDEAIAVYQEAMPGYEVIGMQWTNWYNTDALHCRAIGIAKLDMLFVDHRPLFGELAWQDSVGVQVKIVPYSGNALVEDSLLIHYQVNQGSYMTSFLHATTGTNYTGYLKNYDGNDTIRYFITAQDAAGNHSALPYMGALDPFSFVMGEFVENDLTITPDTLIFEYEYVQQLTIRNFTPNDVTINEISSYNYYVWLPYIPELPFVIPTGDSIVLDVEVNIITLKDPDIYWVYDSLLIVSTLGENIVQVKVNYDLIDNIPEQESQAVQATPNPFHDVIQFKLPIHQKGLIVLELFDLTGRKILTESYTVSGKERIECKLTKPIDPGIYFYQIKTLNEKYSGRLIKQY